MASADTSARPRGVLRRLGFEARRIRLVAQRANTHWVADGADGRVVLRRHAAGRSLEDVAYEHRLLHHLADRGWLVATPLEPPLMSAGFVSCVFPYLPGRRAAPRSLVGTLTEQRKRGGMLARLHRDLLSLVEAGQRPGWRRADEGLFDRPGRPPVEPHERLATLLPHAPPPIVIHGDLAP